MSSDSRRLLLAPSLFWLGIFVVATVNRKFRPILKSSERFPGPPFQPPDLRHFALITRASRSPAYSPPSATPSIRFLSIGSQIRSTPPPHTRSPSYSCASFRSPCRAHKKKSPCPDRAEALTDHQIDQAALRFGAVRTCVEYSVRPTKARPPTRLPTTVGISFQIR